MRISYDWLKTYVDVKLAPEELRTLLTMSGLSVESVEEKGGDYIFEIEVTSNRPDWLSVIGVAREVAALAGKKLSVPTVRRTSAVAAKDRTFRITVTDKRLCPAYTARAIRGVSIGASPAWLAERLDAVGLRPINNVVDITNFCLFETGEPMHAFDLDKIEGGEVIVRLARKGEKLITLDGVERALDESMIVIADAAKPIALAGIMGGCATEVTARTKNILLEAASFDPLSIRRTARKLALSTESSYRFERKVALENIGYASDRASCLITELAGGSAGAVCGTGVRVKARRTVAFRPGRVEAVLGIAIPQVTIKKIVTGLGMTIADMAKETWKLEIPEARNDLTMEVDIIEEIARVYGYDQIPETLPAIVDQPVRYETGKVVDRAIGAALAGQGCCEIISYSLCSRQMLLAAGRSGDDIVAIRNPLSGEQEVMRSSLLPGMLNAIAWNINRKAKDLKLFELGSIYRKDGPDAFAEAKALSIAVTGEIVSGWAVPARPATFYDLKGMVEVMVQELGISDYAFREAQDPGLSPGECAALEIDGRAAGTLGAVEASVTDAFGIKERVYFCQIATGEFYRAASLKKKFAPLSRFPTVLRDISLIAAKDTLHADIIACIKRSAGQLLQSVELIDRYTGKQVPEGKVSLTYRLAYHDPARTLEEKDIQDAHTRVLAALEAACGAKLR